MRMIGSPRRFVVSGSVERITWYRYTSLMKSMVFHVFFDVMYDITIANQIAIDVFQH